MVQTYQSPVRVYKYPFEMVMAAYERRFPTSPLIPIFVGSEITLDYKSDDDAVHQVERKCQLNIDAPYLLKKIAGVDYVYFMQKNSLDRRKRTLTIEAYNVTFSSRVIVKEQCLYYVHADNHEWTCFEQSASLDVKSFFGFESTVEKIAVKQYANNIAKGKEIIEHYINELLSEGITRIPPYVDSSSSGGDSGNLKSPAADSAIDVSKVPDSKLYSDDEEPPITARERTPSASGKIRSRSGTLIKTATTTGMGTLKQVLPAQLSTDDGDGKLEADYIQRFLGALTPLEESRLCELRYSLHNSHKGKLPNDAHLLRFLRARDFDVHKAREMVTASMLWRKQHNVDKILSTYQPPSVLLQYFPGAWHHHDLQGRPVFVLRLGQLDMKGLFRAVGSEGIVKFILSICEEGLRRTEEATKNFGKPISTWTTLVDLDGLSMRHLWRPGIRTLLQIIEIVEANYPETMGCALIIRAPRVFPVLWTLIGPFIDERTRQKFMFYSGNDYLASLKEYMDEKHVPDFLDGGRSRCGAPDGGHVPKSLYGKEDDGGTSGATAGGVDKAQTGGGIGGEGHHHHHQRTSESGAAACAPIGEASGPNQLLESIYSSGYVYKGIPHEVLLPVIDQGGVLTWDFDVTKGLCEFIILRTPKIVQPEEVKQYSPGLATGLSALSPTGFISGGGGAHQNNPLAFDRSMELGVDVFIEEKAIVCQEGDSVQGSHRFMRKGTYVLQWRYPTDASVVQQMHHSSHTFDFSLPMTHKCKVMYYYDVLDSNNFKGSMASLESCRSSFSSLSLATTGASSGGLGNGGNGSQKSMDVTPVSLKKNRASEHHHSHHDHEQQKPRVSSQSEGKEIIEHYINELLSEGITHIPPYVDSSSSGGESGNLKSPAADSAIDVSKVPDSKLYSDDEEPPITARERTPSASGKIRSRSGTLIKTATTTGMGTLKQVLPAQLSTDDGDGKLEADYIQRFLGALTPLEESRLCELRYSLHNSHKGKLPNDAHLLRFLRARDFDVHKAREMVTASMLWRKQHNVDKILSTYQPPSVLLQYFPGAWHHHDLQGRPVFVLRLGQLDMKGLFRAVGSEGIVKFILSICEEGLRRTEEATKNFGKPISTWTTLVDLDGLSMRHLWRPGIRTLLQIIEIVEANYPETMGCALIIRAPRVFPVLWTLIGPFIDERTRQKFMFYSGNDYLASLKEYMDEKHVPDFLDGGRSRCGAPDGGHVPKSLYGKEDDGGTSGALAGGVDKTQTGGGAGGEGHHHHQRTSESGAAACAPIGEASGPNQLLESIYSSGYVYKGIPHEVLLPVIDQGGVLTWDFDVTKGLCEFIILRTPKIVQPEEVKQYSPGLATGLSALSPTGFISGGGGAHQNNPLAFDRSMELGVDVFIEEKAIVCQEGDSVQGSHRFMRKGTYVLQWRYPTDASVVQQMHHSSHTFDFSLPMTHKCKVMYYYDVLDSNNFKGSMASLESCRSSFSSLSLATTGASSGGLGNGGNGSQKSMDVTPVSLKKNRASEHHHSHHDHEQQKPRVSSQSEV